MDAQNAARLVAILIVVLLGLGVYIWSSLALSGVFAKVGEQRWQAWVPVWNAAVLLRIGGYSPWLVLVVLVPILGQLAFFVVLVMACHRITTGFGYGPGMTVVAALWNPIWASVLAWSDASWSGQALVRPVAPPPVAPGHSEQPPGYPPPTVSWPLGAPEWTPPAQSASEAAVQSAPEAAVQSVPPPTSEVVAVPPPVAPAIAAVLEPDEDAPEPFTPVPPPVPLAAQWFPVRAVPSNDDVVVPAASPVTDPPRGDTPTAVDPDPPADLRWAPPPEVFRAPGTGEAPLPAPEVFGAAAPWLPYGVAPAGWDVPVSAQPVAEPARMASPDESDDGTVEASAAFDEPDDRTVLASRLRPSWTLVSPGERELALTGSEVMLGRQPAADPDHPGAQLLVVPDPTRTVSKRHALLRLVDGEWLVRDLRSTNGVTLVALDGVERTVAPGAEEPLTARFFLGDAEFALRQGPPRS